MAKSATLESVAQLIIANHTEVQKRLEAVEEQVKLTNGRVKALETERAVQDGIDKYRSSLTRSRRWDVQTLIMLLTALGAFLGGLWWLKN